MTYDPATSAEVDDTTSCRPGAVALKEHAASKGIGNVGCLNKRPIRGTVNAWSVHAVGRAVDLAECAELPAYVDWLIENAEAFGVQYVIYRRRAWLNTLGKWLPYYGTDPHTSHAHVELTKHGAATLTVSLLEEADMPTAQDIAEAILNEPVKFHAYDQDEEREEPLRVVLGYVLMELQQIRRK
jgi:hypothetical protein